MAAQSNAIDQTDTNEAVRGNEPDQAIEAAKSTSKSDLAAEDLAAENASLRERLLRALAEAENARRQGDRRSEDAQRYAITNFARELLEVVDNLRRAIEASPAQPDEAETGGLVSGVAATDRLLAKILKRFGVEPINALNAPFDPAKHEAVMEVDVAGKPPRSVVEVLEDGYTLHDRLLRPARVAVAKSQSSPPQEP
jgi:molecular chaperone GrpE